MKVVLKWKTRKNRWAFTLLELLVVIALTVILAGLLLPVYSKAHGKAKSLSCLSQLRQIGMATLMYTDDHRGRLPRSTHSATAHGEKPWGFALVPYLRGTEYPISDPRWTNLFNSLYRCPVDLRRDRDWSYGKNVYPELSSQETGGPTWARLPEFPHPSATVLFAEKTGGSMADHFMANFWSEGGQPEVDRQRHGARSNYLFGDAHVASTIFERTYDLKRNLDQWNPETAR